MHQVLTIIATITSLTSTMMCSAVWIWMRRHERATETADTNE